MDVVEAERNQQLQYGKVLVVKILGELKTYRVPELVTREELENGEIVDAEEFKGERRG